MNIKKIIPFLLLLTIPSILFAARPSINVLNTRVNQLEVDVNQIDDRVSNLEKLHEEVPVVTFGQIEFEDFPRIGAIDIHSFYLQNDAQGSLSRISVDIAHNALIAELSQHVASGTVFGSDAAGAKYPGQIIVDLAGVSFVLTTTVINNLDYSKLGTGDTSLSLEFTSVELVYSGSCSAYEHLRFVDMKDSNRAIQPDEVLVSAFTYSIYREELTPGNLTPARQFEASMNANLGNQSGCALRDFVEGRIKPVVIMERYSDAVTTEQPALTAELKDVLIKDYALHVLSDGNVETQLTMTFREINWSSQDDIGNSTQGSWDLQTNTPAQ